MFPIYSCIEDMEKDSFITEVYPLLDSCCTTYVIKFVLDWLFWYNACISQIKEADDKAENRVKGYLHNRDMSFFYNCVTKWLETHEHSLIENLGDCANYLDIQDLLKQLGKSIAHMISKCRGVEEIRELFGIEDDWDERDRKKVEKTLDWLNTNHSVPPDAMDIDI